jgi:hypothetical protein
VLVEIKEMRNVSQPF